MGKKNFIICDSSSSSSSTSSDSSSSTSDCSSDSSSSSSSSSSCDNVISNCKYVKFKRVCDSSSSSSEDCKGRKNNGTVVQNFYSGSPSQCEKEKKCKKKVRKHRSNDINKILKKRK